MSTSTQTSTVSIARRVNKELPEAPAAEQFSPYDERVVCESYRLDIDAHNQPTVKRTIISVIRVPVRAPQDGDDIVELFQEGKRLRDSETESSKRISIEQLLPTRRSSRLATK